MDLPEDFRKILEEVTNKRARFVIDTIMKKEFCSTEDLKNAGYEHAPRAARDVRELGIPLETFYMKDSKGKRIAAYKFGNAACIMSEHCKTIDEICGAFK